MPPVDAFAPEHARDRAAAEAFAAAALPSTDEEVWRYSRIGELDLGRYRPAPLHDEVELPDTARGIFELAAGIASVGLATVNGHLVHTATLGGRTVDGLDVGTGASPFADAVDAFGHLADAFATPIVVRVPAGAVVDPVVIDAGVDSEVTVLEVLRSAEGDDVLVVGGTDIVVAKAARVGHLMVQDLAHSAWQLATQRSTVDADATLTATAAAFGGTYARLRTDCRLAGRGATGNLRAVWFGEGDQQLDFRTFQDHAAPDTTSDLVYKGAVGGRSRSVYTGLIKVRPDARGTNAIQTNRNLKLSDDAWAESVPNLEIENNDVRCAHASAVGPVDEEQRWYVESRGVPTAVAERLIVAGFFDEVVDDLPVAAATPPLRTLINGKLDRTTS